MTPAPPDLSGLGSTIRPSTTWPQPTTAAKIPRTSGARALYGRGYLVTGIIWSQQEFLALAGVRDHLPAGGLPGSEADPRGHICSRYGEKVPADLAVLDMAADDTTVIALPNGGHRYLRPGHLHAITGTGDTRQALHQLTSQGHVLPLSNGLVLAPGLILEPLPGNNPAPSSPAATTALTTSAPNAVSVIE